MVNSKIARRVMFNSTGPTNAIRTDTMNGGGDKKGGIPSRVGYNQLSIGRIGCNSRAPTCMPTKCVVFKITQTQQYGYRATIGGA